jgi:hypothetical protein
VRIELIVDVWDELVRIAASIRSGKCTAVEALARFGSAARGQAVYEGGVHVGRLFRSIFLIDYFTNAPFRAEMQHVLNRGEAVHNVQRAIHIGKIPVELARRQESLSAVSSALTLLSNILMAWNTTHMQRALEEIQAATGVPLDPGQLRRIAPTHRGNQPARHVQFSGGSVRTSNPSQSRERSPRFYRQSPRLRQRSKGAVSRYLIRNEIYTGPQGKGASGMDAPNRKIARKSNGYLVV